MIMRTLRSQIKWIMITITVLFVISIYLGYGLYGKGGDRPVDKNEDQVVATINGKDVMRSSLLSAASDYAQKNDIKDLDEKGLNSLLRKALDQIIDMDLIREESNRLGLKATEAQVDEQIKEIENQFPTKEDFLKYIERTGMTLADLRGEIGDSLALGLTVKQAIGEITVTSEDVSVFYEQLKDIIFKEPGGLKMHYASFKTKELANKAAAEYANQKSWEKLLEMISGDKDKIASTKADKPVVLDPESLPAEMIAVLKTPVFGDLTPVIHIVSEDVYLVALPLETVQERVQTFDEVKDRVRTMIENQRRSVKEQEFIESLRKKANIVILDKTLLPPVVSEDTNVSPDAGITISGEAVVPTSPTSNEATLTPEAVTPAAEPTQPANTETTVTPAEKTTDTATPAAEPTQPANTETTVTPLTNVETATTPIEAQPTTVQPEPSIVSPTSAPQ